MSKRDFIIEELEISSEESRVFGRLMNHLRQQHLTLNGALSEDDGRLMLKLLNDINNSIYHIGFKPVQQPKDDVVLLLCS